MIEPYPWAPIYGVYITESSFIDFFYVHKTLRLRLRFTQVQFSSDINDDGDGDGDDDDATARPGREKKRRQKQLNKQNPMDQRLPSDFAE